MNLNELYERLVKEKKELIAKDLETAKKYKQTDYEYFITQAYRYAHYNEIVDLFENMDEAEYNADWKDLFEAVADDTKILDGVYDAWLNYAHPENYNFFCYEDLIGIIKDWLWFINKQQLDFEYN